MVYPPVSSQNAGRQFVFLYFGLRRPWAFGLGLLGSSSLLISSSLLKLGKYLGLKAYG